LILNVIIVMVDSTDGVAVYSTGWRVASIAVLPTMGIATAVVPVSGAAFGARTFEKVSVAHLYAIKIGILLETAIAAATFLLAPQIAAVFTQAEKAAHIAPDLTIFLRIICLFYPTIPFGMLSSSVFQGTGKGMNALLVTLLRTIILTSLLAVTFTFYLGWGLVGIWWGLVAANSIGAAVAFSWVRVYLRHLMKPVRV
jgi:Na+-driven multidrug efflux pump